MNVVVIGEVLWDLFDDAQHIGGAPFNFAVHTSRLGYDVSFISAVGDDDLGRATLEKVQELGLNTRYIRTTTEAPTGRVRVRLESGQPRFTIERPAAYDFPSLSEEDFRAINIAKPKWIYYGTLAQMSGPARNVTQRLTADNPQAKTFYDINLRPDSYTVPLVRELLAGASFLKINEDEVAAVLEMFDETAGTLLEFCRIYAERFGWRGVCITRAARGCALWLDGRYVESPGCRVTVADTVGAGDAFAAGLLHSLQQGWTAERTADFANRLGAVVASRPGAIPAWTLRDVLGMAPQESRREQE
ncbi:MAG TPA: carbohydrate kinase [Phycisphaerae bacterium]|nr:carbohydrate kinase [Phycisphaerae bacterium]HUX17134.1 carbohydrate kinase [Phycisphaerae bacterium]